MTQYFLIRRQTKVALALAVAAIAAPAFAQSNRETLPPRQVRVLIEKYAECIVRYRPDQVRTSVRSYFSGGEVDFPVLNECAESSAYSTTEMQLPADTYRYAMAAALYAVDYGGASTLTFDAVPLNTPAPIAALDETKLPSSTRRAQEVRDAHERAVTDRYLLIVGDCIARTAPAATRLLVVAPVETPAEAAAIGAIQPTLAECLPQNQTVRLNRSTLRGVLALSAYRLSDAVAPVGGSKRGG